MNPSEKKVSEAGHGRELITSLVLLLLFWLALSLPPALFTPQGLASLWLHLLVGAPLAYLVIRLSAQPILDSAEIETHRLPNILRLIRYFFYLIVQILIAGVDVARRIMRPVPLISPGLIKFRTPLKDPIPITLNANSITLTPGTITIDVQADENGSTFWVHSISEEGLESVRADKGFVDKILDIYR